MARVLFCLGRLLLSGREVGPLSTSLTRPSCLSLESRPPCTFSSYGNFAAQRTLGASSGSGSAEPPGVAFASPARRRWRPASVPFFNAQGKPGVASRGQG